MIVLMAVELSKSRVVMILNCAWYIKKGATFSDIIAFIRRHIWYAKNYTKSSFAPNSIYSQDDFLETLLDMVCYAA